LNILCLKIYVKTLEPHIYLYFDMCGIRVTPSVPSLFFQTEYLNNYKYE